MIHRKETALFNPNAIKNDMEKSRLLSQLITQSMGLFRTEKVTYNGGVVIFMHDRPKLEDSKVVWKISADGMKVSTDGMLTWNAGIDSEGNATVNLFETVGISFDWAKGGTLTLGGAENGHGKLAILDDKGKEKVIADNTGIKLKKGAELITDQGVLTSYVFNTQYWGNLGGYEKNPKNNDDEAMLHYQLVSGVLPSSFKPVHAQITLGTVSGDYGGYSKNIALRKYTGPVWKVDDETITKQQKFEDMPILNNVGDLDGTQDGSTTNSIKVLKSGNIIDSIEANGLDFRFIITSDKSTAPWSYDSSEETYNAPWDLIGAAFSTLTIVGYYKGEF